MVSHNLIGFQLCNMQNNDLPKKESCDNEREFSIWCLQATYKLW
jgi:hypothetical protein